MTAINRLKVLILISTVLFHSIGMALYSYLGRFLLFLEVSNTYVPLILTLFPLTSVIFPTLVGKLSDRLQNRVIFIIGGAIGMIILFLVNMFIQNLPVIILTIILYGFMTACVGISFVLYQEVVLNEQKQVSYYNASIVLGWFIGAQSMGIFIDFSGIEYLFLFLLIFASVNVIISLFLREDREFIVNQFNEHSNSQKTEIDGENFEEKSINKSIYFGLFFRNFGLRPIMSILSIIMAFFIASDAEIGFLIGINPLIQFFLMILMGKIISRQRVKIFMIVGYLLSSIVVIGYVLSTNFWSYLIFQILISFSYSMFWSATHFYIARKTTPQNKGKYVGYANSSFFLGSVIGGLYFSGIYSVTLNYFSAMLTLTIFPLLSAIIIGIIFKRD